MGKVILDRMTEEQAAVIIDDRTERQKNAGLCPECGKYRKTVKCRKQNTAYVDEIQNFIICCKSCMAKNDDYWRGMWADYYNDVQAGIQAGNLANRF